MKEQIKRLQEGRHHDPFEVLGVHPAGKGFKVVRVFIPQAEQAELVGVAEDPQAEPGRIPMERISGTDIFEVTLPEKTKLVKHFGLHWLQKGQNSWRDTISPYTFEAQLGEVDLHLFAEGKHHHAYRFLGAHLKTVDGIDGCLFSVWAPNVQRISVMGDFNRWDGRCHAMRSRGGSGVWELFIPGLQAGDSYKYEILTQHGELLTKTDPYARAMAVRPDTTSRIVPENCYDWMDADWLRQRAAFDWQHEAISIYELHVGSWRRAESEDPGRVNGFLNWRELADQLIPYVKDLGYSHIELMPVAEHPLDQSWGYQVTGFFAPTSRFGSPDDFRFFVDQCHLNGIGVFIDWVPAHFPKDEFALARFNGEALYEHADPRQGEHQDWGTLIFNYGRNEVRNFLITNAVYWLEEFHIDGLRVDAVASMLYLNYSRKDGEWIPNQFGGAENLEAIRFLREMNTTVHGLHPGVVTMAEESTAWPMVSRPVEVGGLGFSMKWNMGWMNDNLSYIENDPVYRQYHHDQLTFSQIYSYTENFILPLSHDEVVHGKRSLISKMPGDFWQKFANLRLFYAWQYAHPGKKLLFMGCEFAQWEEWSESRSLDWALLEVDQHQGVKRLLGDLNRLYRQEAALHQLDFSQEGFQWIDCHDSSQSVLSFIRWSQDRREHIVCVLNFTPMVRTHYRIGVPGELAYQEILNSDSSFYTGSNCGNGGLLPASETPWSGFERSISLTLPPLGALFLKAKID